MTSSCDRAPGHPATIHSSCPARVPSISASSSGQMDYCRMLAKRPRILAISKPNLLSTPAAPLRCTPPLKSCGPRGRPVAYPYATPRMALESYFCRRGSADRRWRGRNDGARGTPQVLAGHTRLLPAGRDGAELDSRTAPVDRRTGRKATGCIPYAGPSLRGSGAVTSLCGRAR